jgi:hypothetical protein
MINQLADRKMRRQTLFITLLALVAVAILWNIRELEFLVYPLRLFVTYVHEASHSLAAIITGGSVNSFTVSANGSGLAITTGGARAFILPAGYLGAALFGSMLFFLTNRIPRWVRGLSVFIGAFMIVFTLMFARPDETGSLVALFIGLGFGAIMLLMGWKAPRIINQFLLNTLAVMTALNAVLDVWMLVSYSDAGRGEISNDAAAFASEFTPLLPTAVVAFIWSLAAAIMLGIAVYFGMIKPLSQELSDSVSTTLD